MTDQKPKSIETQLAVLNEKFAGMEKDIATIKKDIGQLVTSHEFKPVARVVYGIVGFVGLSFLAGVAALVLQSGGT